MKWSRLFRAFVSSPLFAVYASGKELREGGPEKLSLSFYRRKGKHSTTADLAASAKCESEEPGNKRTLKYLCIKDNSITRTILSIYLFYNLSTKLHANQMCKSSAKALTLHRETTRSINRSTLHRLRTKRSHFGLARLNQGGFSLAVPLYV